MGFFGAYPAAGRQRPLKIVSVNHLVFHITFDLVDEIAQRRVRHLRCGRSVPTLGGLRRPPPLLDLPGACHFSPHDEPSRPDAFPHSPPRASGRSRFARVRRQRHPDRHHPVVRQCAGRADGQRRLQEPRTEAVGRRSGERAALRLELSLLSGLWRALPPARPAGHLCRRSAPAAHNPECAERQPVGGRRLSAGPRHHRQPLHRPADRRISPCDQPRDVPRDRQRGHHAELYGDVCGDGAGRRVAGAADGSARDCRFGRLFHRLAVRMAADVSHPSRDAGRALAVRAAPDAALRLDRALPRHHGRGRHARLAGLARARGRRRPVRPHLDRQGGAFRLGGLHLAQGRLSVGRHRGLPAGHRHHDVRRPPRLGHLALRLDVLADRHGLGLRLDPVARPQRRTGTRARRGVRRHLPRRRGVQPLFPTAGSADADQRHGLGHTRLGADPGGDRAALAGAGSRRDGRRDRGPVCLQCLEHRAAARTRQQVAAGHRAAGAAGRPGAHRFPAARFRLDDGLRLAALGHGRARRFRAGAGAPGAAEVQVDRLHRQRAAPSRLEHGAACRGAAARDRPGAGAWLRGDGGAPVGHSSRLNC